MEEDNMRRPPANDAQCIALLSGDAWLEIGQLPDAMTRGIWERDALCALPAQNPHPSGSKKNISLRSELRRARDVSVLIFPPVSTVNVSVLVKKCLVEHNLKSEIASAAAAEGEDCCSEKSSEAETKMEQRLQISMGMGPSPSLASPLPILPLCTGRTDR